MEADLPPQHRPIPGSFGSTHTPLHGIRVDAERERAGLCWEKLGSQSIAIGVSVRERVRFELTRVQLLDISHGLSFLHSLDIVHGDLKGVRVLSHTSVHGNLTTPHPRTMSLLTGRAVRVSVTSGSPVSLALTVRRLHHLSSEDPSNGWPPSSLAPTKENRASPRPNQTLLL